MSTKKARGIRKPRGYQAGNISRNLYTAEFAHIPGNELVSGEAVHFLSGCQTFAALVGMKLKCDGLKYEVHFTGLDKPRMKALRLKQADVKQHATTLGMDICERILWAIENKDGYFFKDLARLCETPEQVKPSLREWLILTHWDMWKGEQDGREQDHYFTARQLCDMAFKRGLVAGGGIPERQMHEVCGQLGIKLSRGKGWKKPRRISN